MQRRRTYALALGVAVILSAYLVFWLHLLPYLGIALGAFAAVAILVLGATLGDDPDVARQAFRQAAPDLAGRAPGQPDRREPRTWDQPAGVTPRVATDPTEAAARTDTADGPEDGTRSGDGI
jgi:hypothetical protein